MDPEDNMDCAENVSQENEDQKEVMLTSGDNKRGFSRLSARSGVGSRRASAQKQQQQQQQPPPRSYTPEQRRQLLKRALDDVVTYGISVRLAAESHGLAKSSLSDYIRRQNAQQQGSQVPKAEVRQASSPSPRPPSRPSPPPVAASHDVGRAWGMSGLPTLVPWLAPPAAAAGCDSPEQLQLQQRLLCPRSSELLTGSCAFDSATVARALEENLRQNYCYISPDSMSASAAATSAAAANLAHQLCEFVNRSPSPFHAVAESRRMLEAAGFSQLREDQAWSVRPNQRSYVTRNGSTIFAFAVGGLWKPGNGFSIVGAHTDSPCLRLKPASGRDGAGGIQQCGVETYGGGLWYTWFDRDLTAAGRAIVRTGADPDSGRVSGGLSERLVNLEAPIFKVPSLAIHLDRTANDSFAPNKENHLAPILCQKVAAELTEPAGCPMSARHPAGLVGRVAEILGCQPGDIVDWELCLADTQPGRVTGLCSEFVSSPRLDNLLSCFGALTALIETPGLESDTNCRLICLYDHEEVGSESAQGAGSAATEHLLRRLAAGGSFEEAIAKSMLVSADVAHAVHPNYEDKHERRHRPTLFGGIVVKTNSNQRYATNARTAALLRECLRTAEPAAPPLQEFVIRQDAVCGSTIGPILAARLGLATVDVGAPVLGMHSCRETGAAVAPGQCAQLMSAFFAHYPRLREAFVELE